MQLLVFLMTVVTMGSGLALGTTLGLYLQYARFDHVYLYVQDIYICAIFNLTDHSRRLLSHPTLPGPHLVVLPYHGTGIHVMFKFTISYMMALKITSPQSRSHLIAFISGSFSSFLQSMVAYLPSLLSRLSLPQFDMQETVWAQIILKVGAATIQIRLSQFHFQTSSLALAFLTIVLTLSLSKVKSALPCFIVCFYLKVQA